MNQSAVSRTFKILMCCVAWCGLYDPAQAQQPETTRDFWNKAYSSPASQPQPRRAAARVRRYRNVTPQVNAEGVASDNALGVTVWQLQPARPSQRGERLLLQAGSEGMQWVPVRVSAAAPLQEGSRIRLSIEPVRSGFLYVVDREQFADGSVGEPLLIFPIASIRGGSNQVSRGRIIEIPDRQDEIPYFSIQRIRPDHTGELLTILITPQPLSELVIGDKPLRLTDAQVALWEQQWGQQTGHLEYSAGIGAPLTKVEKEAGADPARTLKDNDPVPQSVFYNPQAKPGEPLMVKFRLQYGSAANTTRHTRGRK
ncbi:MAG: hypothetical protein U0Z53_10385 [Blastocatellia bacterium]